MKQEYKKTLNVPYFRKVFKKRRKLNIKRKIPQLLKWLNKENMWGISLKCVKCLTELIK